MLEKETAYADIGKIIDAESNEKEFLLNLGLVVIDGDKGKCLKGKWNSHHKIIDAYTAVFVLL